MLILSDEQGSKALNQRNLILFYLRCFTYHLVVSPAQALRPCRSAILVTSAPD